MVDGALRRPVSEAPVRLLELAPHQAARFGSAQKNQPKASQGKGETLHSIKKDPEGWHCCLYRHESLEVYRDAALEIASLSVAKQKSSRFLKWHNLLASCVFLYTLYMHRIFLLSMYV